jgi:hypothetical protein
MVIDRTDIAELRAALEDAPRLRTLLKELVD